MHKKRCGSISDAWYNFEVGYSVVNIMTFILFLIVIPFVFLYVKLNNLVYYIKNR